MSIHHQLVINTTENVKAKTTLEREAQSQGVAIKGYHTNNRIFNTSNFMEDLLKKQQKIWFSGSGASHQNVSVERAIKTIATMAKTMLMHAALIWPEGTFSTDIWPMEMDYVLCIYTWTPDMQSVLSAIEIFSRSRFDSVSETFSNCHVWGCPAYVLEPKLQKTGLNITKWAPRILRWG